MKPGLCHRPASFNGRFGNPHRFGGLVNIESGKESKLDYSSEIGVPVRQSMERFVELDQVEVRVCASQLKRGVESDIALHSAAPNTMARLRVVDQDPTHKCRRDPEKVGTALPCGFLLRELHVRLVNEGGRLQGVSDTFSLEIAMSLAVEFGVDKIEELGVGIWIVSVAPFPQLFGYRVFVG